MTFPPTMTSLTRSTIHVTDTHDSTFPALHRVHPRGWINDPNGILRTEDGRWHVFFQHNPASTRHELIQWGHMSSPDLVSWREEPRGPRPRPGEADQDGCWSGIGLLHQGVPTLVYSGVDGVDNQLARVIVSRLDASAATLTEPGVVVADIPEIEGLIGVRDPFVFTHGGRRWAVQGAGIREQAGSDGHVPVLLLYSCDDLEHWEHVGTLLRGDDPVAREHAPADLWECPQLVQLGDRWVLLLSLWRHPDHSNVSTIQVNYLVGDLVADADALPRFVPTDGGRVDLGPDFYAPQAVVDEDADRVLLWGWSWEGQGRSHAQTDAQAWAGTLTFPRELRLDGGTLTAAPARELAVLRAAPLEIAAGADGGAMLELPAPARAEVRTRGKLEIGQVAADGTPTEIVSLDAGPATAFLDGSLLELIPDASAPVTLRFYPDADGAVRVHGALQEAWTLAVPTTSA